MARTQEETLIRASICKTLRNDGWYVQYNFQGMGSLKGIADNYILKGGRSIWVEFKTFRKGSKASADQEAFRAAIVKHGGEYRVVRCEDDIEDLLEQKLLTMLTKPKLKQKAVSNG